MPASVRVFLCSKSALVRIGVAMIGHGSACVVWCCRKILSAASARYVAAQCRQRLPTIFSPSAQRLTCAWIAAIYSRSVSRAMTVSSSHRSALVTCAARMPMACRLIPITTGTRASQLKNMHKSVKREWINQEVNSACCAGATAAASGTQGGCPIWLEWPGYRRGGQTRATAK